MTRLLTEIETAQALGYGFTVDWKRALKDGRVPKPTEIRGTRPARPLWSSEVIAAHLERLQAPDSVPTRETVRKRIAETTF